MSRTPKNQSNIGTVTRPVSPRKKICISRPPSRIAVALLLLLPHCKLETTTTDSAKSHLQRYCPRIDLDINECDVHELRISCKIGIFATGISASALTRARLGKYENFTAGRTYWHSIPGLTILRKCGRDRTEH
jgi:hypothetical protein